MDERDYKALNDSLKNEQMENKETTDKIPIEISSAKEFLEKKYPQMRDLKWSGNQYIDDNWVARQCEEYAKLKLDYHLTKQAEVIAEKAKIEKGGQIFIAKIDKQSILQASEEYKQSVK